MARPDLSHRVVLGDTEVLGGAAQQQGRGARHLETPQEVKKRCVLGIPIGTVYRYGGRAW